MTTVASRTRSRLPTALGALAALTTLAAGAAVLPATGASASAVPCSRSYDTATTWHLRCGHVYLTHSVAATNPGPGTLALTVVLAGADTQLLDRVGDDLLTTVEQLSLAAAVQDPGQVAGPRDAALAAATDAAQALGQQPLPLAGIADDPRPHPWLQQVAGDWTAAVGLLQATTGQGSAGDRQQAAALLDDAYQLIIGNA